MALQDVSQVKKLTIEVWPRYSVHRAAPDVAPTVTTSSLEAQLVATEPGSGDLEELATAAGF